MDNLTQVTSSLPQVFNLFYYKIIAPIISMIFFFKPSPVSLHLTRIYLLPFIALYKNGQKKHAVSVRHTERPVLMLTSPAALCRELHCMHLIGNSHIQLLPNLFCSTTVRILQWLIRQHFYQSCPLLLALMTEQAYHIWVEKPLYLWR